MMVIPLLTPFAFPLQEAVKKYLIKDNDH